ncbi:hypothetical protein EJ02DRAFT_102838 [Clathrospora elynae]|uniref:Uncharacterized protein n=1 Tax=Clathrospora elynae TaxID=706981 RepID=A0A6A5S9A5_9PLEO|nr:hypothetical protein EJ02DRAFT_102838 [Clathrospora elynae]
MGFCEPKCHQSVSTEDNRGLTSYNPADVNALVSDKLNVSNGPALLLGAFNGLRDKFRAFCQEFVEAGEGIGKLMGRLNNLLAIINNSILVQTLGNKTPLGPLNPERKALVVKGDRAGFDEGNAGHPAAQDLGFGKEGDGAS